MRDFSPEERFSPPSIMLKERRSEVDYSRVSPFFFGDDLPFERFVSLVVK